MILFLAILAFADLREQQWLYREVQGVGPAATFLAWDYSSVIMRATCDDGAIVIDYYGDGTPTDPGRSPALIVDDTTYPLETVGVARFELSQAGQAALLASQNVDLDAANEMDEPWYLGSASALRRVAAECAPNK